MSTVKKREALMLPLFVLFALLEVALVIRAWGRDDLVGWAPPAVLAALLVFLVVGGEFEFWKIKLSSGKREEAIRHIREAAHSRGQETEPANEQVIRDRRTPARKALLWVDDHPEGNLHESLALANLGFVTTQTTSTENAIEFLRSGDYDAVITDLGRGDDPEAGLKFLEALGKMPQRLPAIVYTGALDERAEKARQLGAKFVAVRSDELLKSVLTEVS